MKTLIGIVTFAFVCFFFPLRALGMGEIQTQGFTSLDIRVEVLRSSASEEFESLSKSLKTSHEILMKDLEQKVATLFDANSAVAPDRLPAKQ